MKDLATLCLKADLLHFLSETEMEFIPNGMLWIENGNVKKMGTAEFVSKELASDVPIVDYTGKLILPGFIDGHVHAVQTQAIASYGKQLLDWLESYTFPLEQKFEDPQFARSAIRFFLNQLLKNGTTSAAIFPSRHAETSAILFEEASELNMRILAGKTAMDRNAPQALCDETGSTYQENSLLINTYHQKNRLSYLITPRFAITSTPEQLSALGKIKKEYPAMAMQTHISENKDEVSYTKKLFPKAKNYLDVYDREGLLGKGTLLAHGIYLEEEEWSRIAETQTSLVHCPTSNLFLGSGLFNIQKCRDYAIPLALGSDVGGGISFSMLKTAAEAYKVAALQKMKFTARDAFYLLTLGGAKALNIDQFVGNFETGKEADFVIIDPNASELMQARLALAKDIDELLFVLMILGDERNIEAVYLQGEKKSVNNHR
ncbi:MAG: guanine deaminase [Bacteroidales bacterium]|nr:guanine deaminase [Bacteroidales bacterium]